MTAWEKVEEIKKYYKNFSKDMAQSERKNVIKQLKRIGVINIDYIPINDLLKKNVVIEFYEFNYIKLAEWAY